MASSLNKKSSAKKSRRDRTILKNLEKEFLVEESILKNGDFDDARLYLDFPDVMLIVIGKDQRILKINKKGCEVLGYPEEKIIGKNYFDNFIPVRFRNEMKSFFNELVSGKKILRRYFENPVLTKKGERLIAWRNTVLKKPDGTIAGTLSEGRDITEEREKEKRLIESEKRFRLLFETAPAGYVACLPDGKIQDVNQYITKLTDFGKEELIGKNFRTLVFSKDKKIFNQFFDTLKKSTLFSVSEFRLSRKDGTKVDVYCTARISTSYEGLIQLVLYDITHRRMMGLFQKTQEKIGLILNEAIDSKEILMKVPKVIKKMLGFKYVSIKFRNEKHCEKEEISKCKKKFSVSIPIKTNDEIGGALCCSYEANRKIDSETINFLKSISRMISVGLQRCEYYEKQKSAIENFNTFLNSSKDMAFIKDSRFRYIFVNFEYSKFFNKKLDDILGKTDFELMEIAPARRCRETDIQALKEKRNVVNEEVVGGKTYETRKFPVRLEGGEIGVGAFIRDITEEKQNREKIKNIMEMYSILYQVNQIIVRAKDTSLFKKVCEIACENGKFDLAWIGMADYENKRVVPVAGSNRKRGYYENISISLTESEKPEDPVSCAIKTGEVCICNDLSTGKTKWQKHALSFGIASCAAVPIKVKENVIGSLNLYSNKLNLFSKEIKDLLLELGSDIGLCVDKLNAEEIRKRAEQQLRESEMRLRSVFENIQVPAAEIDLSEIKKTLDLFRNQKKQHIQTLLSENPDIISRLKKSIRVININKKMFELFNTQDTKILVELLGENLMVPEIIESLYKKQGFEQRETKIRCADGLEKDVIISFGTIPEKNDWSRIVVSIFDITERIHIEKNLRATLSRFTGFFETSTAGMAILDLDGRLVALNNRICEMLGYTKYELEEMKLVDVVHPDEIPSVLLTYERLAKGEIQGYTVERRYIRKDGSVVYAYVSAGLIFDPVLNRHCVTAVAVDITERKLYQKQLERIQNVLTSYAICNEIFSKAEEEKPMLFSVCNELTKNAKLGFAFVVLRDYRSPFGFEIASYPDEKIDFLHELKEFYLENQQMACPTMQGLFEKKQIVLNDIETSNYPDFWKQIVLKHGFHSVFVAPLIVEGNSIGVLSIFSPEKNRFSDEKENSIIIDIAESIGHCITILRARKEMNTAAIQLKESYDRLQQAMEGISLAIAKIIETRDPYTAGHQVRVAHLAVAIAKELGLPEKTIQGIRVAGILHDIGKINVPVEILVKPVRLTDDEFSIIKLHSVNGYEILNKISFEYDIAKIVLQHHERLNGSGYPDGIKGEDILLEAKIVAVADVVEAMASDRPYRPALGLDAALEEINQKKGILFDPECVDACIKLFREKGFTFK